MHLKSKSQISEGDIVCVTNRSVVEMNIQQESQKEKVSHIWRKTHTGTSNTNLMQMKEEESREFSSVHSNELNCSW